MRKTTREKTDATWEKKMQLIKHQLEGTQTQVEKMTKEQQDSKTAMSHANATIAKLQTELADARAALGKMLSDAEFVAVERVLSLLSAYSSSELLLIIKQGLSIISVSDPGVCVLCVCVCVCVCVYYYQVIKQGLNIGISVPDPGVCVYVRGKSPHSHFLILNIFIVYLLIDCHCTCQIPAKSMMRGSTS